MKLSTIAAITSVLFFASLGVFYFENRRGTELTEGSEYIKGLDVEKIDKITIKAKDKSETVLTRDNYKFVIENYKSYPADQKKVNDLLFKIANIQVKEKIATAKNNEDLKKFELNPEDSQYTIQIFDSDGKKTTDFRVGKSDNGNFVVKDGTFDVYKSKESIWLDTNYKYYVDHQLMAVKTDEVESIELKSND